MSGDAVEAGVADVGIGDLVSDETGTEVVFPFRWSAREKIKVPSKTRFSQMEILNAALIFRSNLG
jgi:hypothetical protein